MASPKINQRLKRALGFDQKSKQLQRLFNSPENKSHALARLLIRPGLRSAAQAGEERRTAEPPLYAPILLVSGGQRCPIS